jgi:hypothetical protein
MPPVIMWVLGAVGATIVAKWLVREAQRINAELDAVKAQSVNEPATERPSLERDPSTGVYRPK